MKNPMAREGVSPVWFGVVLLLWCEVLTVLNRDGDEEEEEGLEWGENPLCRNDSERGWPAQRRDFDCCACGQSDDAILARL